MDQPRPAPETLTTLAQCRAGIDSIDDDLLALLAERQAHVAQVMAIKAAEGIAAAQPARVDEVIGHARDGAARVGLDADLAERIWRVMVEHFIAEEEAVLGTGGREA